MLLYAIKVSIRNIIRQKTHSLISILGLAVGMCAFLFILYFILDEYNYDRFHDNHHRIYRILAEPGFLSAQEQPGDRLPAPFAEAVRERIPGIEAATNYTAAGDIIVSAGNEKYLEKGIYHKVGPQFFEIFTFDFIQGNANTALKNRNSVAISGELALKYFGMSKAVGNIIRFNDTDWHISAVFKELPAQTHLPSFRIITLFVYQSEKWYRSWDGITVPTYVKLKDSSDEQVFCELASKIIRENVSLNESAEQQKTPISLLPINKMHLQLGPDAPKRRQNILIFSMLAILILIISILNYINLTTARSIDRYREVGIRKLIGAKRVQLTGQYFLESLLICIAAIGVALLLFEWFRPVFQELSGKDLSLNRFGIPVFLLIMLGLIKVTGLLSGIYPALAVSNFKPLQMLSGGFRTGFSKSQLRHLLIIFQFTVCITLMIAAIVVYRQIDYMKHSDTGFEKKRMLILPTQNPQMGSLLSKNYEQIKAAFLAHPEVSGATAHLSAPGRMHHRDFFKLEGRAAQDFPMHIVFADPDFLPTYDIRCCSGRGFSRDFSTDQGKAFVINKSAAKQLGFQKTADALGKQLSFWGGSGKIIGVTDNFHYASLHHPIEPLVLQWPAFFVPETVTLRLKTGGIKQTLDKIRATWQSIYPDHPFDYYFLADDLSKAYAGDVSFGILVMVFTILALFISCMGILGLTIFATRQRTKEIGIRKVMGCSAGGVLKLFTAEFTRLIIIAAVLAAPLAWIAVQRWLHHFAYQTGITWWIFLLAGGVALLIALLTVGIQAIRAALANPVESLRYE